jgi:hypothetical protein
MNCGGIRIAPLTLALSPGKEGEGILYWAYVEEG